MASQTSKLLPASDIAMTDAYVRFNQSSNSSPPLPPPLPPSVTHVPRENNGQRQIKVKSDASPFIKKLQTASVGSWYKPEEPLPTADSHVAPTGYYFVYGTLMDPMLLSEILDVEHAPPMHPAMIFGYKLRLWGQHPVLVDGEVEGEVHGMAFELNLLEHAERLREYETKAYRTVPCTIQFTDNPTTERVSDYCFKHNGDAEDLDDGIFDLQTWLKRMGRTKDANKE